MINKKTTSIIGVIEIESRLAGRLLLGTRMEPILHAFANAKNCPDVVTESLSSQFISSEANRFYFMLDGAPSTSSSSPSITFLKNFVRNPTRVGAIAPSSQGLVTRMLEWFDWEEPANVVEYGPGTGVFTEGIVNRLAPSSKFFAIERSAELAAVTRSRCPDATVFEDSASDVRRLCDEMGMDQIDHVICGLPWASFPDALQEEIMTATLDAMRPGAQFATFAYWQGVILPAGRNFSRRLRSHFSDVRRSPTVWKNLPPAFVYRCTK